MPHLHDIAPLHGLPPLNPQLPLPSLPGLSGQLCNLILRFLPRLRISTSKLFSQLPATTTATAAIGLQLLWQLADVFAHGTVNLAIGILKRTYPEPVRIRHDKLCHDVLISNGLSKLRQSLIHNLHIY